MTNLDEIKVGSILILSAILATYEISFGLYNLLNVDSSKILLLKLFAVLKGFFVFYLAYNYSELNNQIKKVKK